MTGRQFRLLPFEIARMALRCFGVGTLLGASASTVLLMVDDAELAWSLFWPGATATVALYVVGVCIAKYCGSAWWYSKMHQGDVWLHAVQMYRVEHLANRELELEQRIAALREEFAVEKTALEEVREERIAEERMAGFVEGLSKSPGVMAYLANPRNRLRVVPDPEEQTA